MYLSIFAAPWPNRLVTIFTSSGWETSLGMFFLIFLVLDLHPVLGKDSGYILRRELIVERVVYLDGRRPAAHPDALHFFQGEHPVRRDSLVPDSQFLLEPLIQVVRPAQHAADIGAHLHIEFSCRLEAQHG